MQNTCKLGLYLARRAIARTSLVSKMFIIFIMMLTFLNLLIVRGVLVGIADSSLENSRTDETGDVIISALDGETQVGKTFEITRFLEQSPYVQAYSVRHKAGVVIESNYQKSKKDGANSSKRSAQIIGVDPLSEEAVTNVTSFISDGRMLNPGEVGSVVMGDGLLNDQGAANFTGEELLQNVEVGGKVLITIGSFIKEYRVVGLAASKGPVDNRVMMLDTELRSILGRTNSDASEIAIRLHNKNNDQLLIDDLMAAPFADEAKFETSFQAVGEFLNDIKTIFDFLSGFIGLIGIFISGITIFIIIFINAVSRKQEIGITRAIGVPQSVIVCSYFLQSCFYATAGVGSALLVFFFMLEPYFRKNPIDFPFTDVALAVDLQIIGIQALVLLVAGGVAGYIPARMIIKQNILSLILGR